MAGEQAEATIESNTSSNRGDQQLRSIQSQAHSFVRFCNKSGRKADVIWFNYEGHGVKYKTLLPTQCVDVNTYVGHPWMFRDHDTGDRLVVHLQDVFKPDGYPPTQRWPPYRRTINITMPVMTLFETCMKRVRDLTKHQTMPMILSLQEWIPCHIVHDLIRHHKIAAIYYRMARGTYYGASSTSILDVHRLLTTPRQAIGNNVEENDSNPEELAMSQPNGISVDSTDTMCSSRLSINERHAHASRTLGLLSPCSVNTLSPGANNHAHGQEGGMGLLSTVQASSIGDGLLMNGDTNHLVVKKSKCDDNETVAGTSDGASNEQTDTLLTNGGNTCTNGITYSDTSDTEDSQMASDNDIRPEVVKNNRKGGKKTNSGDKIKSSKNVNGLGKTSGCDNNNADDNPHNNNTTSSQCCKARSEKNDTSLE